MFVLLRPSFLSREHAHWYPFFRTSHPFPYRIVALHTGLNDVFLPHTLLPCFPKFLSFRAAFFPKYYSFALHPPFFHLSICAFFCPPQSFQDAEMFPNSCRRTYVPVYQFVLSQPSAGYLPILQRHLAQFRLALVVSIVFTAAQRSGLRSDVVGNSTCIVGLSTNCVCASVAKL